MAETEKKKAKVYPKHPTAVAIAGYTLMSASFEDWTKDINADVRLYLDLYPDHRGDNTPDGWYENLVEMVPKVEDLSFPLSADDETRRFHPIRGFEFMDPSKPKERGTPTEGSYRVTVHSPGEVENPSCEMEVFKAIQAFSMTTNSGRFVTYFLWGEYAKAIDSHADEAIKERAFRSMRRRVRRRRGIEGVKDQFLEALEKWEDKVNETDDPMTYYGVMDRDY